MHVALILIALVIGSVAFHLLSPWWWTPIASNWQYIDATMIITFWITGFVFVAVVSFMAYCVFRFRHIEGRTAAYQPESKKLEFWLMAGTALGVAAMLAPGLVGVEQFHQPAAGNDHRRGRRPAMAMEFSLARQGRAARPVRHAIRQRRQSFGPESLDPNAQDNVVVLGGDLHLPVNKPAKLLLRSIDVMHDFYVPEFRAKMDLMPGIETYFWITPTRTGTFEILCAGFCGVGHPFMRGNVVVDSDEDYQKWLQAQPTFAQMRKSAAAQ